MATLQLPALLQTHTNQQRQLAVAGRTLGEVLENVCLDYPALTPYLTQGGQLPPFISIYLNNHDIRYLDNLKTLVQDNDTITIIPALAGG